MKVCSFISNLKNSIDINHGLYSIHGLKPSMKVFLNNAVICSLIKWDYKASHSWCNADDMAQDRYSDPGSFFSLGKFLLIYFYSNRSVSHIHKAMLKRSALLISASTFTTETNHKVFCAKIVRASVKINYRVRQLHSKISLKWQIGRRRMIIHLFRPDQTSDVNLITCPSQLTGNILRMFWHGSLRILNERSSSNVDRTFSFICNALKALTLKRYLYLVHGAFSSTTF